MFKWIKNNPSLKLVTMAFLISMFVYMVMIFGTIPHLERAVDDMKIFDLSPMGYNQEYAEILIGTMSDDIKDFYRFIQIPLDFIYPMALALFIIFSFAFMSKRVNLYGWLYIFPLLGCIFDYLENIFVFLMLSGFQSDVLIGISSISTIIKSFSTTISFSLLLIIFIIFTVKRIRAEK